MKARYKIALFIAGILSCTALLQRCNTPTTFTGPGRISLGGSAGGLITIEHKNPSTGVIEKKRVYQPDPKSTVITTDEKGNVSVKVRQFGVGLEPGIGIGIADKPRIALDARFAYFKRFGAHTGLGLSIDKEDYRKARILDIFSPYAGVSYVPFVRYSNTSIVASYVPVSKKAFIFVRLRF